MAHEEQKAADEWRDAVRQIPDTIADALESARDAVQELAKQTIVPGPGGLKFDGGKVPFELLPEDALEEIARVLQFGAKKYAARNWEKGIKFGRLYGAMRRHGKSWFQDREDLDPETKLHHLAHLGCEVLFALAFALRERTDLDDRPIVQRGPKIESQ